MATDDTRTRLIEAAGAVFAEVGYEKATVREICRKAGANLAGVNYHFGDKRRLYIETIRHVQQSKLQRIPLPDWPPGTPPETKLRDFIRTILRRMLADDALPWQARLMTREMLQPSDACRETVEDFVRPQMALLIQIIDELVPPETPLHRRRKLAFSVIGQCAFYRLHGEVISLLTPAEELALHYKPNDLADHIAGVLLAGLGRPELLADASVPSS